MIKSISSQPDAEKFRSIVVVIIVLICISAFLVFTQHLSEKAEAIARDRVVSDIKYSLAMMLYDYTIKGKQHELKAFDRENPFIPLAIYRSLPRNYRGATAEVLAHSDDGWHFELKTKNSIYLTRKGDMSIYVMRYIEDELGGVGSLQLNEKKPSE